MFLRRNGAEFTFWCLFDPATVYWAVPAQSNRTTKGDPASSMPDFIEPQLATLAADTPTGSQWVHEIKFDGYRAQIHVEKGDVTVSTRRGYDWSDRFRNIARSAAGLPDCIIDGEAVVLDNDGRTDFGALQAA